jgi:mannose-6-phosphate isomerase-like protein (cupin superfamily)
VSHQPWWGFDGADLTPQRAHDGDGELLAARVVQRDSGPLAFVDLVVVPAGVSVGRHTHGRDEELYIIVSGQADVVVDGVRRSVAPGDVVHNAPGGTHELSNAGPEELRMVVVDVRAGPGPSR